MPVGFQRQIDTVEQSQLEPMFQYYLMNEQKTDIALTAAVLPNATVIPVSAEHGFTVGSYMVLCDDTNFEQAEVIGVDTNNITIRTPLAQGFAIVGTTVVRGDIELNKDGSTTSIDYTFRLPGGVIPIDLSGAIITMAHTVQPGDSLFGGITALTNGCYFRKVDGSVQPLGTFIKNADFRDYGWTVSYPTKVPSEPYSTDININLIRLFGKEIRIDPRTTDYIVFRVRDNLTGLSRFRISVYGSYTLGE